MHPLNRHSLRTVPLTVAVMLAVAPAIAADVTPERLANPEPQNWLMNHRKVHNSADPPAVRKARRRRAQAENLPGTARHSGLG